jgi:F0F1-type ATP synthase membrane subunit b/b'
MSETQFARMITSANMGAGEVCTIKSAPLGQPQRVPDPPLEELSQEFHSEVRGNVKEAVDRLKDLQKMVEGIFQTKKSIGEKDREIIMSEIQQCRQHVEKNLPFVLEQFEEHLEKQVDAAKNEIDAFLKQRTMQLGMQAIAEGTAPSLALPEKET